jgi:glutathione peroxidase
LNGKLDSEVKWNFQKYLIDEQGRLVDEVDPKINPKSDKIINWIQGK